jgi:hypothetical protein
MLSMDFWYDSLEIRKRSRIPHWEVLSGVYSLTFHVADSLPDAVLAELDAERKALCRGLERDGTLTPNQILWIDSIMRHRLEKYLDAGMGSCPMRHDPVASMVAGAIRHFDGNRYRLLAWCVMPNHVHAVLRLEGANTLDKVMHSWKSFTSHEANRILNRDGKFWQGDYFDRTIRNTRHLNTRFSTFSITP